MEVSGPILEIIRIIWDPIRKRFRYHRSVEKYMVVLRKKLEELNSRKEDIESRLNIDLHPSKTLKREVRLWLDNVQKITSEVDTISQEVGERKCLSRARLGKKIAVKIQMVQELNQKGAFTDRLVIDAPPGNKDALPTTALVGDSTAKSNVEEVWNCLMDDNYRKIGVYGMGGVGKTTILKHIHNRLIRKADKFGHVIWISVSKSTSVIQLQDKVACALGVCIPENESEMIRAAKLFAMMRTMKKYILILDDVWEEFQLEDVGIPEPTADNESKLVLTTRLVDVCLRMGCKHIKVELLTEEEAWTLFVEKAGCDVIAPYIETIAKEVAKEGACLPLAIVTIARSMKGVTESCEWRNALEELRDTRGHRDMRRVLEQLKFSYNHLDDEKLRLCLLYCALYPEDLDIGRRELIERLIAGGVIDGMNSRQAAFDKGHAMLNKLEKACLLKCVMGSYGDNKRVKMHDLIRDMVLHVNGISSRLMVKAGMHLREIPNDKYRTEDLEMASLMYNYISEIPPNSSPLCAKLSTLLLSSNHRLRRIPDPFFLHMDSLRFLDLSDTGIEVLPNSISKLEKLAVLLLRGCIRLRCLPSLTRLIALKKLDLCDTRVKEIPQGMEMLINLKYLNLYTPHLEFFPFGILPKLINLQVLVTYGASKTLKFKGEELAALRKLEIFSGQLSSVQDFNVFMISLQDRGPIVYSIRVGEDPCVTLEEEMELFGNHVTLSKYIFGRGEDEPVLPNDIQRLKIHDCRGLSSLRKLFSRINYPSGLESCQIFNCKDMVCALESSSSSLPERLELLKFAATTLPDGTFSNLKRLDCYLCQNIKRLFTANLLLNNLEVLQVTSCLQMKEIIAEELEGCGESNNQLINRDTIANFPMLRTLKFHLLPNLKTIFMGVLSCDSLQVLEVSECPKLRRLPFSLPFIPSSLQRISATTKWWESLEWDQPDAKAAFQPFLTQKRG
ncbi:hypothetical protein PTKIN_Ptkin14bG0196100 [Pterospermum kingtungense]